VPTLISTHIITPPGSVLLYLPLEELSQIFLKPAVRLPLKHNITYDQAKDREVKLEEFKRAPNGTVLVASSMERGVNLPGDLCRVAVVMKVPFLNLGDKQIATRLHSDKRNGQLWYNVSAIRTLVQMCGRGMRSAEDRCDVYILDAQFERLYRENKYLFPEWWRAALKMPVEGGGAVT